MTRPKEGDVFEVELGEGLGKTVGVIARKKGPGHLVYVYLGEPRTLRPEDAAFVGVVGVQGFKDGTWHIRGPLPGFTREGWPIPLFGRNGIEQAWAITLDDSLDTVREERITREEVARLPVGGSYGSVAAEKVWRQLARQSRQQHHRAA